jgi:WS/DGAT/MGAT family acyltransferase
MICRLHHSIADGMALVFVLLSLTDMTPDAPWPEAPEESDEGPRASGSSGPLGSIVRQGFSAARGAVKMTGMVVQESRAVLNDANHGLELLQTGIDFGYAASRLLLLTSDPKTPFKGRLGVIKRGVWSKPLPLREVKAIRKATRATVNDVLISSMTGALRRYLLERDEPTEDFRAVVPVNLRGPDEMESLGNKFGLVSLSLPVSVADPLERLYEVNRRMANLKDSSEAVVAMGILNAMGVSPGEIQSLILRTFAAKATGVLTNVPGPPMPLFLAGSEIEDIMFWVPQSGRLGLGISILSYASKVYLGVATDIRLVPDPERIIAAFHDEHAQLMAALDLGVKPQRSMDGPWSPEAAKQRRPDDLTKINGIGPAVATLLYDRGISSFTDLAGLEVGRLQAILREGGARFQNMDPSNWPEQARYLATI